MKQFLTVLLFISPFFAIAQNTGYAGKKFILKTDALYGKYIGFRNIEAEYALTKHLSLSIGARQHTASYKQTISDRDVDYFLNFYNFKKSQLGVNRPTLGNATISFVSSKVTLKYYFGRLLKKAPRGFYFAGSYEMGKATLTGGTRLIPIFDNPNYLKDFNLKPNITVKNIKADFYEASLGYQEIFRELITLDVNVAMNISNFNKNGTNETLSITTLSGAYFGPNVISRGKTSWLSAPSSNPYTSNVGLSVYVKIGFLLF